MGLSIISYCFIFPVSCSPSSAAQPAISFLFPSTLKGVFRGHIHSLMKGWEVQTPSWASHPKYTELKSALSILYCFYRNDIRGSQTGPVFPRGFKYRSYITKPNRLRFVLYSLMFQLELHISLKSFKAINQNKHTEWHWISAVCVHNFTKINSSPKHTFTSNVEVKWVTYFKLSNGNKKQSDQTTQRKTSNLTRPNETSTPRTKRQTTSHQNYSQPTPPTP